MDKYRYGPCHYEVVYSPDDGGYYADIWWTKNGTTLATTSVMVTVADAHAEAKRIIEEHLS